MWRIIRSDNESKKAIGYGKGGGGGEQLEQKEQKHDWISVGMVSNDVYFTPKFSIIMLE